MLEQISTFRLYLLRALYLLNFALLGLDVWPSIISEGHTLDPVRGVAFSVWGALSLLSVFGLRYPLQMLPLLLMQFAYKAIWLLAIAIPQWDSVQSLELTQAMLAGVVIDMVVIPWPHVFRQYFLKGGERWRPRSRGADPS